MVVENEARQQVFARLRCLVELYRIMKWVSKNIDAFVVSRRDGRRLGRIAGSACRARARRRTWRARGASPPSRERRGMTGGPERDPLEMGGNYLPRTVSLTFFYFV